MATAINVLYLGTAVDIDPTEGNTSIENGEALNGQCYGSAGDPLHGCIHSFAPGTGGYAAAPSTSIKATAQASIGTGWRAIICSQTVSWAVPVAMTPWALATPMRMAIRSGQVMTA